MDVVHQIYIASVIGALLFFLAGWLANTLRSSRNNQSHLSASHSPENEAGNLEQVLRATQEKLNASQHELGALRETLSLREEEITKVNHQSDQRRKNAELQAQIVQLKETEARSERERKALVAQVEAERSRTRTLTAERQIVESRLAQAKAVAKSPGKLSGSVPPVPPVAPNPRPSATATSELPAQPVRPTGDHSTTEASLQQILGKLVSAESTTSAVLADSQGLLVGAFGSADYHDELGAISALMATLAQRTQEYLPLDQATRVEISDTSARGVTTEIFHWEREPLLLTRLGISLAPRDPEIADALLHISQIMST